MKLNEAKLKRWQKQSLSLHARLSTMYDQVESALGDEDRTLLPLVSSAMCAADELALKLHSDQIEATVHNSRD